VGEDLKAEESEEPTPETDTKSGGEPVAMSNPGEEGTKESTQ